MKTNMNLKKIFIVSMDCCKYKTLSKKKGICIRKYDGKVFDMPRRFPLNKCRPRYIRGFTMRSSCAPFKGCFIDTIHSSKKNSKTYNNYHRCGSRKKSKVKNKQSKHVGKYSDYLYNPEDPDKSFDVYKDKNPYDTIPIKYTTPNDVKNTIKKLEKLFKEELYSHMRIWQVGMIMKVRLEAIKKHHKTKYPNAKDVDKRFNLARKYFYFLKKRTKLNTEDRLKLTFRF